MFFRALLLVLLFASVAPGAAPVASEITPLERQRLVAHLEITASWLIDEVSDLGQSQLDFRRAPGTWSIIEVLDHLVVVGEIYWQDLQKGVRTPLAGRVLTSRDIDLLWYGIDRTDRETALASETPKGEVRDLRAALAQYRRHHARLLDYVKTTKDDLRNGFVARQGCDAYQWALLISTHEQRHILQIREIKADSKFPRK